MSCGTTPPGSIPGHGCRWLQGQPGTWAFKEAPLRSEVGAVNPELMAQSQGFRMLHPLVQ